MLYESPFSRVTDLKLETGFLTSGTDEITNNGGIEPVDYEPL